MNKKIMQISGMTCAACSQRIEKVLNKMDGISTATVNLAAEKLNVTYDCAVVTQTDIENRIEKLGYGVIKEIPSKEVIIPISGMTCAACSQRIEKVLNKIDGVEASVNLATEKAKVVYDTSKTKLSYIKQSITKLGYEPLDIERKDFVDENQLRKEKEIKTLRIKFIIAAIFAIPLLYVAMGPMIPFVSLPLPTFIDPSLRPFNYAITQLILVIPVIIVGYRFYTVGYKAFFQFSPNMDSLIAISTTAAMAYSLYSTYQIAMGNAHGVHGLYFETTGMIITLILLGKTMEAVSKGKTSEALKKLIGLTPKTAIVIQNEKEIEMPIDEVEINDIIIVKPGGKIPADGVIIDGHTSIDESMLTGESIPVEKQINDPVYAASINGNGMVRFKATKVGSDTALAQIIKLVEEAQGSKAPIANLADRVSGIFVPIVCAIALVAGIAWYIFTRDLQFALTIFIAVLVIACPCALGLATPTAIMVATGKGAEYGILFKNGESLETTHKINTIIFDKTGTITEGSPVVTDILCANAISRETLLQITASAEKGSEHPLGEAIVKKAEEESMEILPLENFESIPGHGLNANIASQTILIGNKKLMDSKDISLKNLSAPAEMLAAEGKTPMFIAIDGKLAGIIAVADIVKESSKSAILQLHNMGIEVAMITGDNKRTAETIAKQVGIDRVVAEVLPQDKSDEVKKIQNSGKIVAMVGDGINDAPALAQADIGIAIGSGTDVAIESADVVLMKSNLSDVATAIQLSKSTIRNIKQNLFWAFGYNTLGIPIAAGVLSLFGGPLLNPMIGAAAMSLSSVSVVSNALRLKRFRPNK